MWRDFAELGLTALPFNEAVGGINGGPVETMIVMEAIGRGLALEPFLSTVVLAGTALARGGNRALAEEIASKIAEGDFIVAFAQTERQSRYELHNVGVTARRRNGHYAIEGRKSLVLHGDSAGKLLVSARTAGAQRDREGITLFFVDAKAPGVEIHASASQDGRRVAEILLSGAEAAASSIIGEVDGGYALLGEIVDAGIAALAAEAVGAMERLHGLTLEYLKTRKQFGVPIGNFQALQHRAADMMIALEQARSMAYYAAMMAQESAERRRPALSAAKVQINKSARFVGQQAIQLHGGIGVTAEYQAGHYFKRLSAIENTFGDTDYHMAELSQWDGILETSS